MPLNGRWAFWYQKKATKRQPGAHTHWNEGLTQLPAFGTVEGFWSVYSHMCRPNSLEGSVDVMLMREGVQPLWEDAANAKGGKWAVKLRKGLATHLWEDLVLALVGEQAGDGGGDVCGAVLSVRFHDDTIALWNRNADDDAGLVRLR